MQILYPSHFAKLLEESDDLKELSRLLEEQPTLRMHILRAAHVLEVTEKINNLYLTGSPDGFQAMFDYFHLLEVKRSEIGILETDENGAYVYPAIQHTPRGVPAKDAQFPMPTYMRFLTWLRKVHFWPGVEQRCIELELAGAPETAATLRECAAFIRFVFSEECPDGTDRQFVEKVLARCDKQFLELVGIAG